MLVNKEKALDLYKRLEKADNAGALQFILKSAISFTRSSFMTVMEIIQNCKEGKEFEVDESIIYLIERDLKEWEESESNENSEITLTIKGFNKLEEAEEFCAWYSGQGEQDSSFWFECRKAEGTIDVTSMLEKTTSVVDKNNVEMILKMYK